PSRWTLSPLGQPSYSVTSVQSPPGDTRKIRPNGMSTTKRLPARSKLGPSRKQSTASPRRLASAQAVLTRRRYLSGRRENTLDAAPVDRGYMMAIRRSAARARGQLDGAGRGRGGRVRWHHVRSLGPERDVRVARPGDALGDRARQIADALHSGQIRVGLAQSVRVEAHAADAHRLELHLRLPLVDVRLGLGRDARLESLHAE